MKESILVLLPIFLGFILSHVLLIVYGIYAHADGLPALIPNTVAETSQLSQQMGWVFVASLFLRAYSLGGGTYTGIEAVSNNVNRLAEPRVSTGKWAMFYMALSLAFNAGGIILLYMLCAAKPVQGMTLNAVTFQAIIDSFNLHDPFTPGRVFWCRHEAAIAGRPIPASLGAVGLSNMAGFLGTASVSPALQSAGDPERRLRHGHIGARDLAVDPRPGQHPGGAL